MRVQYCGVREYDHSLFSHNLCALGLVGYAGFFLLVIFLMNLVPDIVNEVNMGHYVFDGIYQET